MTENEIEKRGEGDSPDVRAIRFRQLKGKVKRVSINIDETTFDLFLKTINDLHNDYGLSKQFYTSVLIEEVARKYARPEEKE